MPITVGLYAKWGSGKSFLLGKLKDEMLSFTREWIVEPVISFLKQFLQSNIFSHCSCPIVVSEMRKKLRTARKNTHKNVKYFPLYFCDALYRGNRFADSKPCFWILPLSSSEFLDREFLSREYFKPWISIPWISILWTFQSVENSCMLNLWINHAKYVIVILDWIMRWYWREKI